jgi:predicted metallopeptidase
MPSRQPSFDFDLPPAGGVPAPAPARRRTAAPRPFSYTTAMREVVTDIVGTLEELRHVDLDYVLLSISQARQNSKHGVYASCVPLRFEGGAQEKTVGKRRYRLQTLVHEGREMLYVVYFMLPRFHEEQDYHAKLATIIHELYHISPHFNGDIRRFPGKNFAHGHSREVYHAAMCRLADRYLAASPRAHEHEFLRVPFSELLERPGGVVGLNVARPKAVPVK